MTTPSQPAAPGANALPGGGVAAVGMASQLGRIADLDGLRALAALGVIIFHLGANDLFGASRFARLTVLGQTGVELFFVLSGFLITRILLHARASGTGLLPFFIRRSARILPLYYVGLAVYVFVLPLATSGALDQAMVRASSWWWFYLQGVPLTLGTVAAAGPNHYWSLAVEEHFYLLWPFVVFAVEPRKLGRVCIAVFLAALACRALFIYGLDLGVFYATPCRTDGLACGAAIAWASWEKSCAPGWNRAARHAGTAVVVLGLLLFAFWMYYARSGSSALGVWKFSLINLFYAAIVFWVLSRDTTAARGLIQRALSAKPLGFLGSISYGMYVYHPAVIALVFVCLPFTNSVLRIASVFAVTILVSWTSYRFFESPILRLTRPDL